MKHPGFIFFLSISFARPAIIIYDINEFSATQKEKVQRLFCSLCGIVSINSLIYKKWGRHTIRHAIILYNISKNAFILKTSIILICGVISIYQNIKVCLDRTIKVSHDFVGVVPFILSHQLAKLGGHGPCENGILVFQFLEVLGFFKWKFFIRNLAL